MSLKITKNTLSIKMHADAKYNSDLMMELSIVIAARWYWEQQGKELYKSFKKEFKNKKIKKCDPDMGKVMSFKQYKTLAKIKKLLKYFDGKTDKQIMDIPFGQDNHNTEYNKHIEGLFALRKSMWI